MATLRSKLKEYFEALKKPTEEQFGELIDSYLHKTQDNLTVDDQGNLGVGTQAPAARLHINGGLKIGEVPDNPSGIVQGTLRWTGTELQIFFADAWHPVWAGEQNTTVNLNQQLNITLGAGDEESTAWIDFPDDVSRLLSLRVGIVVSSVRRQGIIGPLLTDSTVTVQMLARSNELIWEEEAGFAIPSLTNTSEQAKLSFDIRGLVAVDNLDSFLLHFETERESPQTRFRNTYDLLLESVQFVFLAS